MRTGVTLRLGKDESLEPRRASRLLLVLYPLERHLYKLPTAKLHFALRIVLKKPCKITGTLSNMKCITGYAVFAWLTITVNSQASEEQCAAQICCLDGNQDVSASCWSQCSSYQQQLAELGCHILPPTTTSSSASSVAPTVTTSWGPGQTAISIRKSILSIPS